MRLNKYKSIVIISLFVISIGTSVIIRNSTPFINTETSINKSSSVTIDTTDMFSKEYISQLDISNLNSINYLLFNNVLGQIPLSFEFKKMLKTITFQR